MAASRAVRAKAKVVVPPSPEEIELALVALRERLQTQGALKVSALKPKALQDVLGRRLAEEGYERSGTWLRQPARQQVLAALAHGAVVDKKALGRLVQGVAAKELAAVVASLEREGALRRVLRGKAESFIGAGVQVLAPDSLRSLKTVIAQLAAALAVVTRKKGVTLLTSDVAEALSEARAVLTSAAPADKTRTPPSEPYATSRGQTPASEPRDGSPASLFEALDATRDERTGLSFVPRLVRHLLPSVSLDVAHEMLLGAARQELIELRPEGGLARLSSEELALCPSGPGGTRLSWARRLEEGA